ncbi:hypothetical protein THRCLA_22389 [Thraustotheca clavata]|uniref:Uncharacterized protein n=1 Tax=Thraustotheca clavata TaxID=74557 RepID=A0A1V9Z398_9STRA|nr:hypothetical protein THRCLA_22389 [Thraustotheca clavata]
MKQQIFLVRTIQQHLGQATLFHKGKSQILTMKIAYETSRRILGDNHLDTQQSAMSLLVVYFFEDSMDLVVQLADTIFTTFQNQDGGV